MINKKVFEFLCKKTQKELKKHLKKQLKNHYKMVISNDGYLFAQGTVPILLVAHMDTVHKEVPKQIVYSEGKVSSPQGIGGDDRCGVYSVLEIIKRHKCSVLFCEDEEIGCVGADKFVDFLKDLEDEEGAKAKYGVTSDDFKFNYIIELDRKGSKDAVFYELDNPDFEEFVTGDGDWEAEWGSFSDICSLAPTLGCAAVNLSCGYYRAHTKDEYVVLDELDECIEKTCRLIQKTTPEDKFEWIEAVRRYYSSAGSSWSNAWGEYDSYGDSYYTDEYDNTYIIMYKGDDGMMDWEDVYARNKYEAVGIFLMDHPNLTYEDIEIECYEYNDSRTLK